jgi:cardiolipin synthase
VTYKIFIDGGVRVFEYRPAMLHAKTMVVDGSWAVVGSANVDIRSFRLNFELGALVMARSFASVLEARYLEDLEHSDEITEENLAQRGPVLRIRDKFTRLLSPLL